MKEATYPVYEPKKNIDGCTTPGGYFAVVKETKETVSFVVLERYDTMPQNAGVFTMPRERFESIVTGSPISFCVVQKEK